MGRVRKLVDEVYSQISLKPDCPDTETLHSFFRVLFTASLLTEELLPVRCGICYTRPSESAINRYCAIDKTGWGAVELHSHLEFSADNIKKIALATGDNAGLLGVCSIDSKLMIWGFIDQWTMAMNYIEFNDDLGGPARPGLFIASIDAPGVLSVYDSHKMIAMLNRDVVEKKFIDRHLEERFSSVFRNFAQTVFESVRDYVPSIEAHSKLHGRCGDIIFETIYRIILRMSRYRRGGAIVILGNETDYKMVCHSKYRLRYGRLQYAIQKVLEHEVLLTVSNMLIRSCDDGIVPRELHFENANSSDGLLLARQELEGCIEFVTGLTKIDGALVLDSSLNVLSFGTDIICSGNECNVFKRVSDDTPECILSSSYGHRHKSMIRLCSVLRNSFGIVVSQDGAVKVMYRDQHEDDVHVLENLAINRIQIRKVISSIFSAQDFLP